MVDALSPMMRLPCTVRHGEPGDVDVYGDRPIDTVTETEELCWYGQVIRGETDGVERERWSLYLRPHVEIDANDAVIIGEDEYQVTGHPWRVIHPLTRRASHIEATIERRV